MKRSSSDSWTNVRQFLDTSAYFLLGQPFEVVAGEESVETPVDAKTFLEAFHSAERGVGIRLMLGRASILVPKSKWLDTCGVVHRFIDYYVDKTMDEQKMEYSGPRKQSIDDSPTPFHKSLLQGLGEQTQDKTEIRNQILQGLMASQDTTSVLLSNTVFLLSRHSLIWNQFRQEVLSLQSVQLTFDLLKSLKLLRNILYECKVSS